MSNAIWVPLETVHSTLPPEDWERFMGNNKRTLPSLSFRMGGGVSFAGHIGKPLSARLWEDLLCRIGATSLCVYRHNDLQWTLGWGGRHVNINLDESDNVSNITLFAGCF